MSTETPDTMTILLKEYDTLRSEISERMKTSFSHLGYVGAIVIFGFPFTENISILHTIAALLGLLLLLWISIVNWYWLKRCAEQIREIEERIDQISGIEGLLTWERKTEKMKKNILNVPGKFIKLEELKKLLEVERVKK